MNDRPPIRGMSEANLAIQCVFFPVITVGVGLWLDQKYNFSPWGMLCGAGVGLAMSFVLVRELIRQLKK